VRRSRVIVGPPVDRGVETPPDHVEVESVEHPLACGRSRRLTHPGEAVGDTDGRADVFLADKAWFYVTLLTIGYMISRGLAKAGRSAHRDA
jgi:hypothetical protein